MSISPKYHQSIILVEGDTKILQILIIPDTDIEFKPLKSEIEKW